MFILIAGCRAVFILATIAALASLTAACAHAQRGGGANAPAPLGEKETRTPAQRKIDSQLLYEIYRKRGEAAAKDVPPGPTGVRIDALGRALVDIRTDVTPALTALVTSVGGTILSTDPQYRSVIARVPLLKIEQIASRDEVKAISPAAEPAIRRPPLLL